MLKILLKSELDDETRNIIDHLKREHCDFVEGIYDLYDSLIMNGSCTSYQAERIYYVAYTLATMSFNFTVE